MTKYCNICGRSYEDNTALGIGSCPYNHAAITKSSFTSSSKSSSSYSSSSSSSSSSYVGDSDGSIILGFLLALFLPIIGLIIGLASKNSKPRTFKGALIFLIIIVVELVIAAGFFVFVLAMNGWDFQAVINAFFPKQ